MKEHKHHNHNHDLKDVKIAFLVNFIFTIIELIGGLYTNSLAITSDAIHDLGDTVTLGFTVYLEKISKKDRDKYFTYGYKRFSTLGALINVIVLSISSIFIISNAIPRIFEPQTIKATEMIIFAIVGIFANSVAMSSLLTKESANKKMIKLHLMEDLLGWLAVLIGSFFVYFFDWFFIDPLLSLFISVFVLKNIFLNAKRIIDIVVQKSPIDSESFSVMVCENFDILDLHSLNLWALDENHFISSFHIVLDDKYRGQEFEIKNKIKDFLTTKGFHNNTIETEFNSDCCIKRD